MSLHNDFEEAKKHAEQLQMKHAAAAQAYGHTKYQLTAIQPFWEQLEQRVEDNPNLRPMFQSGQANISAMAVSLLSMAKSADDSLRSAETASLSANYLVTNTATTYSFVQSGVAEPISFELTSVLLPDYRNRRDLAERFAKLDPALGKVCLEIWEALYGTVADPERAALYMLRQTWDHLFDKLAPDPEVRLSKHWVQTSAEKPLLVTRGQRIAYAIDTHVIDDVNKQMLASSSEQMINQYDDLNRAHKRGEFDRHKALDTLTSIYAWLDQWANALKL